jgi:pimeloyl-ACP methyl ester carboxylesterase
MRQLDLKRIALVCHDWGGPTGLSFAMSNQTLVRALTVMSTWAWLLPPAEFHTRVFPWRMMHAPLVGPYLLGNQRALAGRGVYLSVVDRERFSRNASEDTRPYSAIRPRVSSPGYGRARTRGHSSASSGSRGNCPDPSFPL